MRPALQRLLSRPSSLELLRCLVGTPIFASQVCGGHRTGNKNLESKRGTGRRSYGGAADAVRYVKCEGPGSNEPVPNEPLPTEYVAHKLSDSIPPNSITITREPQKGLKRWHEGLWNHEQLEFESDLELKSGDGRRLLDQKHFGNDIELWACLLSYRKRVHGDSGTLSFWNAIRKRSLVLPTAPRDRGKRAVDANMFWPIFLDLGFRNHAILEQIVAYADSLWTYHKKRWIHLYASVVKHFLHTGDGENAIKWHQRLLPLHAPGKKDFAQICHSVTRLNGDMNALKKIYKENPFRNVYSKIIPILIDKGQFKDAYHWHFFLIEKGDLPASSKLVEPLMHYLAKYDRPAAVKFTKSLVNSGVSFASSLPNELEDNTKISREMMNLIHGKTFNVGEKKYNDNLGARWFATNWVSLDIAINAVHALGVQEIGPLSLQAVCLRDPSAKAIMQRIDQLHDLGISIGNSLFSRAVEHFARNQQSDLLEGLLHDDQHPDQLENGKLQEQILSESSHLQDWPRYERTLAIRSLASKNPKVENDNLILRSLITTGDTVAVKEYLKRMQNMGIPVKAKTCAHILQSVLRVRRRGRRPMTSRSSGKDDDLNKAIEVLRAIMSSGSYIPITLWREIIRRLGMLGRLDDLRIMCVFLAHWYGPSSPYHGTPFRVPIDVSTSHPLHPLKVIFNESLQKAIIEWGFIHALSQDHHLKNTKLKTRNLDLYPSLSLPTLTFGISLLKLLQAKGVYIDSQSVRKALLHRLLVYYGPGTSNRLHNRLGQARMRGQLEAVAKQIDAELGGAFFGNDDLDLSRLVEELSKKKLEGLDRSRSKRLSAPGRYLR